MALLKKNKLRGNRSCYGNRTPNINDKKKIELFFSPVIKCHIRVRSFFKLKVLFKQSDY